MKLKKLDYNELRMFKKDDDKRESLYEKLKKRDLKEDLTEVKSKIKSIKTKFNDFRYKKDYEDVMIKGNMTKKTEPKKVFKFKEI